MPISDFTPQISYEQFCEAITDDVKAQCLDENGAFDKARFTPLFFKRLLADTIYTDGADWNDDEFFWAGTGAQNGIDGFHIEAMAASNGEASEENGASDEDETERENERESGFVCRLVCYLTPADLPANGRAVLQETAKIREFLSDVNSAAQMPAVWKPLLDFWRDGGAQNRLELFFVSAHPLPDAEIEATQNAQASLEAAAAGARGALTVVVSAISLQTLYSRDHDDRSVQVELRLRVPDVEAGNSFVIGAATLLDLYAFLRDFKGKRGDLDPLYEKNVRLFLGRTGSINKGISRTLREEPENFGLYNNGLTIVTRAIAPQSGGVFKLTDPSVVNGCQTTRTLWETLSERLREPPAADALAREKWQHWRNRLEAGRVVVKIVRVAPGEIADDDGRLENITRYTNAQNAVKAKDFIALDRDFKRWKREMARHGVFLEILRNEGAAQKAREKLPAYNGPRYVAIAKAFELFKVYGAGWMNEPGDAWNKNAAFVSGGAIFRRITEPATAGEAFGGEAFGGEAFGGEAFSGDDLLAALYLQQAAEARQFGKRTGSVPEARKLTRFLFFRTAIELLRRLLRRFDLPCERADCTRALIALENSTAEWRKFCNEATDCIDEYMGEHGANNVQREPSYGGDFNAFFKKSDLARHQENFPNLWATWNLHEQLLLRDTSFISHAEPVLRAAFNGRD